MPWHAARTQRWLCCCTISGSTVAVLVAAGLQRRSTSNGHQDVAYISDAYQLLSPALGNTAAKVVFGIALLASGQNSTITGTLAGAEGPLKRTAVLATVPLQLSVPVLSAAAGHAMSPESACLHADTVCMLA